MSIQDYFDQSCDDDIEIDEPLHLQPTATYPIGVTLNPTGVQQALDDYERLQRENERLQMIIDTTALMLEAYTYPDGERMLSFRLSGTVYAFQRDQKQKGILEALRVLYAASSLANDDTDAANDDGAR